MDLRNFSDQELVASVRGLAWAEKKVVVALLHHLIEIERRRLYAKESCPSLFEYCMRELKFSESQAYRRICAARLMKDFPELEEKFSSGSLSTTTAAIAFTFFRQRSIAHEEKMNVLLKIQNRSSREIQIVLRSLDPNAFREMVRPISQTLTEYRFAADTELSQKLERLKNVLCTESLEQLVRKMADVTLQKYDPLKKAERNLKVAKQRNASTSPQVKRSRHIPAHVRHAVWLRDQGRCTFPSCGSEYGLELDHITLFCHGGQNTVENLRLRCHAHNQLHAEEVLGEKKVSSHRPS